jgi:hypothetical protein
MPKCRYQLLGAKVQLKLNTPAEASEMLALRDALSDKHVPVRDVNGFRKLILVLTRSGRLSALHSGDGRVLWTRVFPPGEAPSRLLPWRAYHDLQHAPEVLLLREAQPGAFAAVLSVHTGEELSRTALPFGVGALVRVPVPLHEGVAFQSQFLLVEDAAGTPRVRLLPDTPASRAHFAALQRDAYYYQARRRPDAEAATFQGYRLSAVGAEEVLAQLAWQVGNGTARGLLSCIAASWMDRPRGRRRAPWQRMDAGIAVCARESRRRRRFGCCAGYAAGLCADDGNARPRGAHPVFREGIVSRGHI